MPPFWSVISLPDSRLYKTLGVLVKSILKGTTIHLVLEFDGELPPGVILVIVEMPETELPSTVSVLVAVVENAAT